MDFNIPDTKTLRLSDAEKFVECLKIAARECNMSGIRYNKLGMLMGVEFSDGSAMGSAALMINCGWISKSDLKR